MKKKIILTAGIAALVLAFLLFGLPLVMRLAFGRSQQATLLLWQFRKEAYTTGEAFDDYLREKQWENAGPYVAPPSSQFDAAFDARSSGLMQYYLLGDTPAPEKLIVYFPGGSYTDRPRQTHWQFVNDLARDTGAAVAVPIYPTLPDTDAAHAYAELLKFFDQLMEEHDCGELIFMGDSAGGGMALSLAMLLRDSGRETPDKLILICPWLDVTLENPDVAVYEKNDAALDAEQLRHLGALWAGELSPHDPIVSPLYGHCDGLGKITLVTTTGELLYPDIMRLDAILTVAGIEHETITEENLFHIWPLYESMRIPESQETYARLAEIITE